MPRARDNTQDQDAPVRTVKSPICYGCTALVPVPGYCPVCLKATERELQTYDRKYLGCVLVHGYWINAAYAPGVPPGSDARQATRVQAEELANLTPLQRETRRRLLGLDGEPVEDEVPF